MKIEVTEIDKVSVEYDSTIPEQELPAYVERGRKLYGNNIKGMHIEIDPDNNDFVRIEYQAKPMPFQRLRRITGYLVGSLNRWNNAKRAEEKDRVKHFAETDIKKEG